MTDLDELQRLLMGKDKEVLDDLASHLRDPAERARFIAQVLPQAVRDAAHGDDRLTRALQNPVAHCIQQSVQRDSRMFADALYPAMGPAIRKSISETLRQFVQSINQAIEHSLSVKGMRWRWQAWRSGVSFAEIVLKNTLLYRVEEVYLIHHETGLLVEHVAAADVAAVKDQDAVSAMLSAIQDFVRDTLSGTGEWDLETLEMGERTLWLIRGPQAMMACAIRGIPPADLRDRLRSLLDEIHLSYTDALGVFKGDREAVAGVSEVLSLALVSESRETERARKSPWTMIVLFALLIAGGIWLWQHLSHDPMLPVRQDYLAALEQEPGLVQIRAVLEDGRLHLTGLRDPLARDPLLLADKVGLPPDSLELDYRPYQSLEKELILQRVRNRLKAPPDVQINLEGDVLRISGKTHNDWIQGVARGFDIPAGVSAVDLSELYEDIDDLLRQLHETLQPPADVRLRLDGHALSIIGNAPWSWMQGLDRALKPLTWLESCDVSALEIQEWSQAKHRLEEFDRVELIFEEGVEMTREASLFMEESIQHLVELQRLAGVMGIAMRVRVTGHSDGIGNQTLNYWLRYQRAEYVKQSLEKAGVPVALIETDIHPTFAPATQVDPARRKVVLSARLEPEPRPDLQFCH